MEYLKFLASAMKGDKKEMTPEIERASTLKIEKRKPTETEKVFFESDEAVKNINEKLPNFYEIFFEDLKKLGVNSKYINFVKDQLNPAERVLYEVTDSFGFATCSRIELEDLTRTQIKISSPLVIGLFRELRANSFYKHLSDIDLADIVIKNFLYHELTHTLQKSYALLNSAISNEFGFPSFEEKTKIEISGPAFFTKNSKGYHGEHYQRNGRVMQDKIMESEKQAQGVGLYMLAKQKGVPESIKKDILAWHKKNIKQINDIMKIIVANSHGENPLTAFSKAKEDLISNAEKLGYKNTEKLLAMFTLPAHIGYMFPKNKQQVKNLLSEFSKEPKYSEPTYI